jgi:streptothricin hydrolase
MLIPHEAIREQNDPVNAQPEPVAGVRRIAVAGVQSEMCVSATIRGTLSRRLRVVLVSDAHGTYDVDDIPSTVVSRVAEHALGDEIELTTADAVTFLSP